MRALIDAVLRDGRLTISEQSVEVTMDVPARTGVSLGARAGAGRDEPGGQCYQVPAGPPVRLRLRIAATVLAEEWRLTVGDNGIGFDMRYRDRIFGLFNRLVRIEAPRERAPAWRLSGRYIEKQGGRVWAESAPGAGATFFVALPRLRSPE